MDPRIRIRKSVVRIHNTAYNIKKPSKKDPIGNVCSFLCGLSNLSMSRMLDPPCVRSVSSPRLNIDCLPVLFSRSAVYLHIEKKNKLSRKSNSSACRKK
jgi:hypothetical protein